MKYLSMVAVLAFFMLGTTKVNASGYYLTDSEIEYLSINANDAYFRGKGASGNNPGNCEKSDYAMLPGDHQKFNAVYSMLLSAQSASKSIKVYVSGCHNGYPKVSTVHLLN